MSKDQFCPRCGRNLRSGLGECPFCHARLGTRVLRTAPPAPSPEEPAPLAKGSTVAELWVITEVLSADGEGILYAAVEKGTDHPVQLKEFAPSAYVEGRAADRSLDVCAGSEVHFKNMLLDFEELYRALAAITPAMGLLPVLGTVRENGTVYAVMEASRGRTLTRVLRDHKKPYRPEQVRSLLQPVMEGVAAMHKAGLVHRGISPENICVTNDGTATLEGYGTLSLRNWDSGIAPRLYPGYTAPEQYSMREFEGRFTDVYALGAVAYRLVTGHEPQAALERQQDDEMRPATDFSVGLPPYFSDVLASALQLSTTRRIQNVPAFMGMLASPEAAASGLRRERDRTGTLPSFAAAGRHSVSTRSLLTAALAMIAVLVFLLAWAMMLLTRRAPQSEPVSSVEASPQELLLIVPDLTNWSFEDLKGDTAYRAQFDFRVAREEYSDTVEKGRIISQSPAGNTTVPAGENVITVIVSKGPSMLEVPMIVGFTRENAEAELNRRGIQFSEQMVANNGEYAEGCVAVTAPAGGVLITPDTIVAVYIAAERDNTVAPPLEAQPEDTVPEAQPEDTGPIGDGQ